MDTPPPLPAFEEARWPLGTLLICGYFGNKSPEGRQFHRRCVIAMVTALIAAVMAVLLSSAFASPRIGGSLALRDFYLRHWLDPCLHLLGGGVFAFISWAFWKYLLELDELARNMQLQAICLTYLTGLGGAGFVAALAPSLEPWHIDPLVAYLVLEPVRGFWLWMIARRYQ